MARVDASALHTFATGLKQLVDTRIHDRIDRCAAEQLALARAFVASANAADVLPAPALSIPPSEAPACVFTAGPERRATPSRATPSKRILERMEVFESASLKYQTSVFRGNTPLKKTDGATGTPQREAPGDGGQEVEPISLAGVAVDLRSPDRGAREEDAEVRSDASGDAQAALTVAHDPVAPPSPACIPPVPDEAANVQEVVPEFQVHTAKEKGPHLFSKAVRPPASSKLAVSSDRLMRGVPVTGLARKLEAPASGLPDAKKPAPRPKAVPSAGLRKPSPLASSRAPGKENQENVRAPSPASRMPSPRSTAVHSSPRPRAPAPRKEPPRFVLSTIAPLSMDDNYDLTDKEGSDDDEDMDRSGKFVPSWVRGWQSRVKAQAEVDPDTVFGPIPRCDLSTIFGDDKSLLARKNRAWRPRGSSNDWEGDKLRTREVDAYKEQMRQTRRAVD